MNDLKPNLYVPTWMTEGCPVYDFSDPKYDHLRGRSRWEFEKEKRRDCLFTKNAKVNNSGQRNKRNRKNT